MVKWSPLSTLDTLNGSVVVKGVMGQLLDVLLNRRNISYDIIKSELNFGTPLPNKSWTGMSGFVQRNDADIMLGPPLMNVQRMQIMDFSAPLMVDKISILSHFSKTNPSFDYLRGFDSFVWSFSAAESNDSEINEFERLIGKKMIQVMENESSSDDQITQLTARKLAYVTSESRLIAISMNICKRRSQTELYIGNEKMHFMPRALGLSKSLDTRIKRNIDSDIFWIHSTGIFSLWIRRSINDTLLKCIKTDESVMRNNNDIMFTLNLLTTLFKVMFCMFYLSFVVL
ncbi:unnamed protein product, partial [Medioppia subpectinata]